MDKKNLVIVESPTKAKTIRKFLSKEFEVVACIGHVRDLPSSASQIPEKYKKFEWSKIGVNAEDNFSPIYVTPKGKSTIIREIKQHLKNANTLYLATDEDREGESISWHLLELLKPKVPIKRMVFHEITKKAITKSLDNCRELNLNLVKAQEARRILDRLYGYTLSPLLWKKVAHGLSAGRVQSSGLKIIAERELDRMKFVPASFCSLKAELNTQETQTHSSKLDMTLSKIDEKNIATGKDFDHYTGKIKPEKKDSVFVLTRTKASTIKEELKSASWLVKDLIEKPFSSNPPEPYITSTLQQDSNRKLNLSAKVTMQVAQKLYEEGYITYMRTDSPNLSKEASDQIRDIIKKTYGSEFLSDTKREFKAKTASAQEAHEAIRPAGEFKAPSNTGLNDRELALYKMIWSRTLACQMKAAKKVTSTIHVQASNCLFSTSGTRIIFPGYLEVYSDKDDLKDTILPKVAINSKLFVNKFDIKDHQTKPNARFTEASLIQFLEKQGIGRPSTYASIISTIIDRNYVRKQANALVPTFIGIAVVQLLQNYFPKLIDYQFTSEMENSLDKIACGELIWTDFLKTFYLGKKGLKEEVAKQEKQIKPEQSRTIHLAHIGDNIEIKVGKYGPYIICQPDNTINDEAVHASIPEELAPADLKQEDIADIIEQQKNGPKPIGEDPKTGLNVYCLLGRYGPYLQLGEATEENPKPRRQSLPKGETIKTISLGAALKALSLPRELGLHPEKNMPIIANMGRFGPYVECDGEYRSIKEHDFVFEINLEQAVALLAEEKKSKKGNKLIKEFKDFPKKRQKTCIYIGKFGPYLKIGRKNHSIPKEIIGEGISEEKLKTWDEDILKKILNT